MTPRGALKLGIYEPAKELHGWLPKLSPRKISRYSAENYTLNMGLKCPTIPHVDSTGYALHHEPSNRVKVASG